MLPTHRPRPGAVIAAIAAAALLAVGLTGCGGFRERTIDTIGAVAFETALPIPPLAESTVSDNGTRVFHLDARAGTTQFVPGVETATLGFDQPYFGPTLVANAGEKVAVDISNSLDEVTTVHWHGMHLPAVMDGGPHQEIAAGDSWRPTWTIDQPAATLWYHPHPHGATERQAGLGLAGLFIVRDEAEAALPLPRDYGIDDIPVAVQDVTFDEAGQIMQERTDYVGTLGDTLLVNGAIGPYLDVTTDVVRLRLLNASTARIYDFAFADDREFAMIASDGGLLERPVPLTDIQLSPGERAELLVNVTPGESVALQSRTPDLGGTAAVVGANGGNDSFDVLELRAAATLEHRGEVPPELVPVPRLSATAATAERTFVLEDAVINQKRMDPGRIDEAVTVNTTEIWDVRNAMPAPHNFHVHDVHLQVLTIDGEAPPPELAGWKDTVYMRPGVNYQLIMRFADYTDPDHPYMYHCHLLRHEDDGMMGQFVVVKPGQAAGTVTGSAHGH
jgi:bilirubin oxidase